jgi:Uri superfamily endonuclease
MVLSARSQFVHLGSGSYAIIFQLKADKNLRIGKLGKFSFPKGYYIYTGSAFGPGGLESRIHHHLKLSPKPHWHVDYLRRKAAPVEVWVSEQRKRLEHQWASVLSRLKEATIPSPGFGSSDCNCQTHLFHFKQYPSFQSFRKKCHQLYDDREPIKQIKIH